MKFSRLTLAAAVSAALVLSSCTGADDTSGTAGTTPAGTTPAAQTEEPTGPDGDAEESSDEEGTTTDGGTTTEGAGGTAADVEDATGAPGDAEDTTAAAAGDDAGVTEMAGPGENGDVTVEEAEEIAAAVLDERQRSLRTNTSEVFRASRDAALVGSAHEASTAVYKLRGVFGKADSDEAGSAPEPNVLAISRADDEDSHYLLVQTVPEADGVPLLHLMVSESGEADDFRIMWEAPMLPGTTIPTFDRRSVGTPVLLEHDEGDLDMAPRDLLKSVAAYTSWPQPEEVPDYRTHGYGPAVRRAAEAQAAAVADQATLREKNWLVSADTRTLLFEDGSAMVFGTLLRDTTFTVRDGGILTPPEAFTVLAEDDSITEEAVMRTMSFIAMRMPAKEGDFKPEMLAAREQLVDAWGS